MKRAEKVIISCAIPGLMHTPSMSLHLPVTADEIASQAPVRRRRGQPSCIFTRARGHGAADAGAEYLRSCRGLAIADSQFRRCHGIKRSAA
jgi:hypothetical protein